ncbi:MAG: DNA polymerase Y family protein [Alphaproteobacteria bacterium]|nr:DNA polymerase Y family protein [Alphaproteobacteria bacterium]
MRRVISLWLPTLSTDRICRAHPDWRAEPLVTAAVENGALVIRAANAAAQADGIHPGLKVADGRAMIPGLRVVDDAPAEDRRALAAVADWCDRYTPFVGSGGDGLFLDITGCAHLFGGEAALLDGITARLHGFGFAARGALADTPGAAWAVARYGRADDRVVPPNGGPSTLAGLPVAGLRLDPATTDTLDRLGLKRVGELAALPRAALAARFGTEPGRRLDQAYGTIGEPISPRRPAPALRARLVFTDPVTRTEDIAYALDHLLADLCRQLEQTHRGVRRLELALFQTGGGVIRLAIGTSAATRDRGHLARLFAEPLARQMEESACPGTEIEAALLAAPTVSPFAADQLSLDNGNLPSRATHHEIAALVDRLANRLGTDHVFRHDPAESHIPERAVMPRPVFAAQGGATLGWRRDLPRPLRLFARPEPVDVVASIPEGPPALIRWRRQMLRVRHAAGPERIAPEWWLERSPTRDYYRVEDRDGRRLWLYRAGLYRPDTPPQWFLHGLFT